MRMLLASALTPVLFSLTTIGAGWQTNRVPAPSDVAAPPAEATRTASGLATKVIRAGSGKDHPAPGDLVTVYSTGWTTDGNMWARGEQGTFIVEGGVFGYPPGMSEGVQLMVPGETRRMWIPESLAYKDAPAGYIVPKGMVVMDVQLIDVQNRALRDVKGAPAGPKNTGAQNAAPSIDSSKVRFVMVCCVEMNGVRLVFGVVAKEIDLSQDDIARQILEQAARFAQDRCPVPLGRDQLNRPTGQFKNIQVMLSRGDPATLTDDFDKRDRSEDPFQGPRERMLKAAYPDAVVYATNDFDAESLTWWRYENKASSDRREAERRALANEQERQRQQLIAHQREVDRAAQQRVQSEIAARSAAFAKANGVKHFVTIQQLTANPFVYQGQVVAIACDFIQMNSATQGVFSSYGRVVVSGIPTARFTRPGSLVILAGRVLGNIEARPGSGLVPHLSFVGSAFCRQPGCGDYAFNLK
jgi:hypothetical protein